MTPLTRSDLARAVRDIDEQRAGGSSLPGMLNSLGLNADDAAHVASQRELRVAMLIGLPHSSLAAQALWLDGLACGVRALQNRKAPHA